MRIASDVMGTQKDRLVNLFVIIILLYCLFFCLYFWFFRHANVSGLIVCLLFHVIYCLSIPYLGDYQLRVICSAGSIMCQIEAVILVQRG